MLCTTAHNTTDFFPRYQFSSVGFRAFQKVPKKTAKSRLGQGIHTTAAWNFPITGESHERKRWIGIAVLHTSLNSSN
jgi:hypothetical protein